MEREYLYHRSKIFKDVIYYIRKK